MSIDNNFLLGGVRNKKSNSKLLESKKFISNVLDSLKNNNYDVQTTIKIIEQYVIDGKGLERLIYSQLTTEIYSINGDEESEVINQNISRLLDYTTSDCEIGDCQKIILKFYDHYQLANFQFSKVNKELESTINRASVELTKEIKAVEKISQQTKNEYENMERQNITILGIFASIVLTFVGGMIFSSSVLSNIHSTSIFRLVFISCIIGIVFINMIHLLLSFIMKLNNKDDNKFFNLKSCNYMFLIIMIFTTLFWFFVNSKMILLNNLVIKF
ncbi:MAG: hypothetical protein ACRC6U_04155, partial [Fusobacteriaceae bacterium]